MVLNGVEKHRARKRETAVKWGKVAIFNRVVSESLLQRDGREAVLLEGIQ